MLLFRQCSLHSKPDIPIHAGSCYRWRPRRGCQLSLEITQLLLQYLLGRLLRKDLLLHFKAGLLLRMKLLLL